jgi:seryl-tRNA synthetase (EC 6.1.1.11)
MLRWRGYDESMVDQFMSLDSEWRGIKAKVDELRHRRNALSSQISKAPPEARGALIEEANKVLKELDSLNAELSRIEGERDSLLRRFPNLIHESVYSICQNESVESVALKYVGRPRVWRGYLNQLSGLGGVEPEVIDWQPVGHADMLEGVLGLGDTAKAGEVAGSRFFYLFDDLAWLNLALSLYAIDFLTQRGFRLVMPPHMLNYDVISSVIDFEAFKDAIYSVDNGQLYLIGTAEHPLAALYRGSELLEKDLPILLAGFSPSYRREAGAGNRDLKGIFRVHQFYKVEQFAFTLPEDSWNWHEKLLGNLVEIWSSLEIPFRVVLVCPREMSRTAAKQYDLEAWMPAQGVFREMASCSNVTDWQSYRLGIRVIRKGMKREYVHTSTAQP